MARLFLKVTPVTVLLYIFLITSQVVTGLYIAGGLEPPALFTLMYAAGLIWILGWWMRDDSKRRGMNWIFDMGFFLLLAWPIVLPYHLLKSRGMKGVLVIIGFAAIYLAAIVSGIVLYLFLAPADWPSALPVALSLGTPIVV